MSHHDDDTEHDEPQVHTTPQEGHPAGDDERSDRDIGGPAPERDQERDDDSAA
ncbi:MAG: hypothetical protein WKF96_24595 [Solirubrobacteraceae bacterium]